jgi:hypothetical protein
MSHKGPRRDVEKERFWRRTIRQQRQSGRTVRDYCRENALSEPSFYAWRREITRRSRPRATTTDRRSAKPATLVPAKPPRFVSVQLASETMPSSAAIEVALPSGVMLKLSATMEPAAVAALVHAWEEGRC